MRPRLAAIAARQGGLFSRQQALEAGYTLREVKARARVDGPWTVVRTGVYVARSLADPLDARQRWQLADRAALLTARRPAVLSHDSAARLLEIPILEVDVPRSHVTMHGVGGGRTSGAVTRHRDQLPLCIERRDGLVATSYARTAIDIGRLHGYRHGLVAVDAVRQLGVPLVDLQAELARMTNHPFIARADAAVAASDSGAESVLETLGRELVLELGIGDVDTQFGVRLDDGHVVWCDMRVGCHVFECEGLVKVLGVERGGLATEPPEKVLFKQRKRQTAVCSQGLGLSPIYWSDIFGQARERAKERLRREYAVTEQRFGRVLPPHLQDFADRHPRRTNGRLWLPGDLDAA